MSSEFFPQNLVDDFARHLLGLFPEEEVRRAARVQGETDSNPLHNLTRFSGDPLGLARFLWPDNRFYDRQEEIVLSVRDNRETWVSAAHQMGKDYVAGYVASSCFLCPEAYFPQEVEWVRGKGREPTVRIVSTSVKDDHLRVLWGEMGRFLDTCQFPLQYSKGGSLVVNHRELRKVDRVTREIDRISYLIGTVSKRGEGLAGHHADITLLMIDEASGVEDVVYTRGSSWARKVFVWGNPYPSSLGATFFEKGVEGGDMR